MGRKFIPRRKPKEPKTESPQSKKKYQSPGYDTSYQQQKRNAWNNYRAYFEPAMTKYRQNIFDAVLDLGRSKESDIKKIMKRIVRLNDDYIKGCTNAMAEYLHIFTKVHTTESLDNRGIDWTKMLKLAAQYESTKDVPKPKREIVDRKTAKARTRAKTAAASTRKRKGKKV